MPGGNTPSRWSWTHLDVDKASQLWDELVDFVVWLAAQSDATLRGDPSDPFLFDNQRVTRARLAEVVRTSKT